MAVKWKLAVVKGHVAGLEGEAWSNLMGIGGGDVAGGRSESAVVGRLLLERVSRVSSLSVYLSLSLPLSPPSSDTLPASVNFTGF